MHQFDCICSWFGLMSFDSAKLLVQKTTKIKDLNYEIKITTMYRNDSLIEINMETQGSTFTNGKKSLSWFVLSDWLVSINIS